MHTDENPYRPPFDQPAGESVSASHIRTVFSAASFLITGCSLLVALLARNGLAYGVCFLIGACGVLLILAAYVAR